MRDTLEQLVEETVKVASASLWPMPDGDVVDCLRVVHRWEQTLAALKVNLAREAATRGVPATAGHRTLAGWLRTTLLLDPAPARDLATAVTTLHRRPQVAEALLRGEVDMRQAQIITAVTESLPETLASTDAAAADDPEVADAAAGGIQVGVAAGDAATSGTAVVGVTVDAGGVIDAAEATLLQMADRFPAYQLRRLGERILTHVAPDIADQADAAALSRAERRAHAGRQLTFSLPVDGTVRLSGRLDVESAALVSAALQPLCTPVAGDDRTAAQRRADALVDVCGLALRTGRLPTDGGEPPQLTVTVPYETVTSRLRTGVLDNGARLSPQTVRRLACDARILPIVLGSTSQVLDAGRTRRLAGGPLRRALVARDHGCAFPDCDRPARWCDAHHLVPWSHGGPTNLDNLVLLCRHHHRLIHNPDRGWTVRLGPDQHPDFYPPAEIDADRNPRRNAYHLRV